jgi:hypothetical protein
LLQGPGAGHTVSTASQIDALIKTSLENGISHHLIMPTSTVIIPAKKLLVMPCANNSSLRSQLQADHQVWHKDVIRQKA